MNAPHGEFDTRFLKCLAPGEDMLIDTVEQRAIRSNKKDTREAPVLSSKIIWSLSAGSMPAVRSLRQNREFDLPQVQSSN